MRAALILVGLMLASQRLPASDEIEPLDGAFLEYLANMEGDGDDWTFLADAGNKAAAAEEPARNKAAESRKPPAKEAAKPAVEK